MQVREINIKIYFEKSVMTQRFTCHLKVNLSKCHFVSIFSQHTSVPAAVTVLCASNRKRKIYISEAFCRKMCSADVSAALDDSAKLEPHNKMLSGPPLDVQKIRWHVLVMAVLTEKSD